MALEAVVYPQDPFGCAFKDFYSFGGGGGGGGVRPGYDLFYQQQEDKPFIGIIENNNNSIEQGGFHANNNWEYSSSSPSLIQQHQKEWDPNSSSPDQTACTDTPGLFFPSNMEPLPTTTTTTGGRRKRRRTKSSKNKQEIENQRMTHIAVERNRRKQMNEYLAVLRSLMPPSYVQRVYIIIIFYIYIIYIFLKEPIIDLFVLLTCKGDQASIIGGSINYVKELEQLLQSMEAQKRNTQQQQQQQDVDNNNNISSPFADFFSFPQYSMSSNQCNNSSLLATANDSDTTANVADIEVSMMEAHANLKIRTQKRPRQLLKLVASFQNLRLSVLHLNVTTVNQTVMYSISVKVEEGCKLNTMDEIAAAVNQILVKIEEEARSCF
ncbi:hypothetical protein Dsin_002841 [Dipteronia sinensis]|uniref:BHLH domain-containing protein n=1 Tax=Dipteronia sinensis TaxID=43782 RepID=A0AAE0B7Z9_9ROSI|nr:hypothetical protein Dsin_002841 [Dipteronia sinensis]